MVFIIVFQMWGQVAMIVNHCGEVKGRRCGRTVNDSPIRKPVEFQNERHAGKASVSWTPSTRNNMK